MINNTKYTREQLVEAINLFLSYEQGKINTESYFSGINRLRGTKSVACKACASATRRQHSDFQIWVWRTALDQHPDLVPEAPEFVSFKFNNEFYKTQVRVASFKKLQDLIDGIVYAISGLRGKNNEMIEQYKIDKEALMQMKRVKAGYFLEDGHYKSIGKNAQVEEVQEEVEPKKERKGGRKSKIDQDVLLQMKQEGKTNAECATHFDVSKAAITQTLKLMNYGKDNKEESIDILEG